MKDQKQKHTSRQFIGLVFMLLSLSGLVMAQPRPGQATDAIEGLDPVLLVKGKETQGEMKITATRGSFRYLFANEENKAIFEKDPGRYEIQLDGACARMGAPTMGNPDLFTVYKGKIYIFGSEGCKKLFEAAPEDYLPAEKAAPATVAASPAALKRGRELIEQAVSAVGGAGQIDSLKSYQEKAVVVEQTLQGNLESKTSLISAFPDRIRQERSNKYGSNTLIVKSGEAFIVLPQRSVPISNLQRENIERQIARSPLMVLRARNQSNFKTVDLGAGKIGDASVERVAVECDGGPLTLSIEEGTGRIVALSYQGRAGNGVIGEIQYTFSDFRTINGVTLPYKAQVTVKGRPYQSITVESIALNAEVPSELFEKPKTSATP